MESAEIFGYTTQNYWQGPNGGAVISVVTYWRFLNYQLFQPISQPSENFADIRLQISVKHASFLGWQLIFGPILSYQLNPSRRLSTHIPG